MKKIIMMTMAILISAITFSQTFYKVTECGYSKYIDDEWKNQETNYPSKMFVIMNKSNVKITNEDESNFMLYGEVEKDEYEKHTAYTWNAYDKDGKECKLIFKVNKGGGDEYFLSILYGFYCLEYTIQIQK